MTMPDPVAVYDTIYALASGDGRESAFFGNCAPLAQEAFRRSLIQEGYPEVWFEVPLSGAPRFDLHVALAREDLHPGSRFASGAGNGYDDLLTWYANDETGGNGLAFAYDLSERGIDAPALHVNVNGSSLSDMGRFFDLAVGGDAAARYADFTGCLPGGWRVWYAGVHPGRADSPVRVDCFVDSTLQQAYLEDVSLLERDLRVCGFTAVGSALRELVAPILSSPFSLELQFDVHPDGGVGPTLGVSAGFPRLGAGTVRKLFGDEGPAAAFMRAVEALGLSDDRWGLVPETAFARLVPVDDAALALYSAPTFVKLRMRNGEPLDAKVYLQAGASVQTNRWCERGHAPLFVNSCVGGFGS